MFTPLLTPRGEYSLLFKRRMEGAKREFHPQGKTSPLGVKGAKLRMGL
jgi:hypothetical protein